MSNLDPRREAFCQRFLIDLNATTAYAEIYAVKKTSASAASARLMADPKIIVRIKELMAERSARVLVDADDVLRSLLEIRTRCMCAEPVLDLRGEETGEWKFDSRGALKANELLGKHLGMWHEKLELISKPKTIEDIVRECGGGTDE